MTYACQICAAEYPAGTTDCWRCRRPGGPRAMTVKPVVVVEPVAAPEAQEALPDIAEAAETLETVDAAAIAPESEPAE